MTKRGARTGTKKPGLDSIRLEDFPENEDLASSYFDWEYDGYRSDSDEDEGTVIMKKADFLAEEDFIEKSLKMLDNGDDYSYQDDSQDTLEDFTLHLDSSYFDKTEDELAASDNRNRQSGKSGTDNSDTERTPRSQKSSAKRSGKNGSGLLSGSSIAKGISSRISKSDEKQQPGEGGNSVARLFAAEDEAERKKAEPAAVADTSAADSEDSDMTASRKSSSGTKTASAKESKPGSRPGQQKGSSKAASAARPQNSRKLTSETRISRAPSSSRSSASSRSTSSGDAPARRSSSAARTSSSGSRSNSSGSSGRSNSRSRQKARKKTPIGLKIAKFFIFLLLWAAVAVAAYKGYQYAYDIFYDVPVDSTDISKIEVTLNGTETNEEVGQIFLDNGLIDNINIFTIRCKYLYKAEYRSGTFKLSRSFNTEKIINILAGYDYASGRLEEEETTTAGEEDTTTEEDAGADDQQADEDQDWQDEDGGDYDEDDGED